VSIAGKAAPAQHLTSDMVLVHKVFRRELRLLAQLIAGVQLGDSHRASALAAHYGELATALRHHHQAEQDLLLRKLSDRAPLDPAVERQLAQWRREHAALMSELEALLPMWVESTDAELRAVVADILTELAATVADHLDAIETAVLPAVDRHFSPGEWLALGLRAASWIPINRMAWMLGAMLEDATPEERKNLMSRVPAPARLLYRMVGQEQYVREMRALRGGLTPA